MIFITNDTHHLLFAAASDLLICLTITTVAKLSILLQFLLINEYL